MFYAPQISSFNSYLSLTAKQVMCPALTEECRCECKISRAETINIL